MEELESLNEVRQRLKYYKEYVKDRLPNKANQIDNELNEELDIIETSLKRLEEHDKIFKKYDIKDMWLEPALYVIKNHFPMDTETQLKKLKVLDIIEEKDVDVHNFKKIIIKQDWTYEQYIDEENDSNTSGHQFAYKLLTEEEFSLLKGVLL